MEFFPTCYNLKCDKNTGCNFKKGYEYLNNSCHRTIWKGDKPCPDRLKAQNQPTAAQGEG